MHRTATTATLLVTVAVSAVSGCVTVQRPLAPGAPSGPAPAAEPRPDGRAEPQIVQAPAREALEMIGPSRRPSAPAPAPRRTAPSAPAAAPAAPPRRAPADPPRHPEPQRAEHPAVPRQPRATAPVGTDVCALGRQYGGWNPDSTQATICKDVYGR
ncbi:hypothetical protein QFZ24_008055 [Streptomyces phaeochromogenes]|uniref:hypothetical protein n=1 Tax=Streptomyces phaeochromogenes TaxID=1923 RepID=UPI0027929729|nr:hypothetical protein [Streptomyces phaeochromogenes]MDQ0954132.1 hypothetical protein [Streptomyces phaeochromogenes]